MNREFVEKIANAVLYEGYMLYPYRPSAIKNQQRWTLGILYPPAFGEVRSGTERSGMHSECLLEIKGDVAVQLQLRFLQRVDRQVEQSVEDRFEPVQSLKVEGGMVESWDEGVKRCVEFQIASLWSPQQSLPFSFSGGYETESLSSSAGQVIGRISRTWYKLAGTVSVTSKAIRDNLLKLAIDIENASSLPSEATDRSAVLGRSLLSAHTILTVTGGCFVSLLEPPANLVNDVSACKNVGNFPVLVGDPGTHDMLLCSPIVLYDYPQIAPESAGDFYDATEIDEMLTLRLMTLTDDEKNEMRQADDRVRTLLQRTEERAREQLMRMHGTIRTMRPVGENHD